MALSEFSSIRCFSGLVIAMGDLAETASRIMSRSAESVEIAAQNISNMATSGYKRRVEFSELVGATSDPQAASSPVRATTDFSQGKVVETGSPYDLAITGSGFFALREKTGQVTYSRQGRLMRDADGRLATPTGAVLLTDSGADLILRTTSFKVTADGVVLEDGAPVARIGLAAADDPGRLERRNGDGFTSPDASLDLTARGQIHQGGYEAANVSTGDEMVAIMAALRRAESGQKLMGVYDDLMGRVLSTFGQN